jgi:hypothetical protein
MRFTGNTQGFGSGCLVLQAESELVIIELALCSERL